MKKNLLASAICLAVATSPVIHATPGADQAVGSATAITGSASSEVATMAQELAAAAQHSPSELKKALAEVESPEQARELQSALDYLTEQQLIDADSAELVQARIAELSASAVAEGSIFGNTLVQVGLVAVGVGGIAAAAGGGGGGGGASSPAPVAPPVEVSPPPVAEPAPPVEQPPVVEPTPPVEVLPPVIGQQPSPVSQPTQDEYDFTGGMHITGIQAAHARGFTGSSAVVAVLDTGFYSEHVELDGQFAGFYNAYTGSELATDAIDVDGHGTHVAGIIAAKANDYMGVGYAPDTKLLGVRIGDDTGKLTTSTAQTAAAFRWARENGADFINNSWGPSVYASDVTAAEVEAVISPMMAEFRTGAQNNVIYIWANGNDGSSQPSLYAALPQLFPELKSNWVAVANVDSFTGVLHSTSQACGDAKDWCISAPGSDIWAPAIDGSSYYAEMTGTSMAAPAVTGALAVLKDAFPMLTNEQIVSRLFFTADKGGIYANMALYGQGLMDLDAATNPVGTLSLVNTSGESAPMAITTLKLGGAFGTSNPLQGVEVMALDAQGAGFVTDLGGVVQTKTYRHDLAAATDRLAKQTTQQISAGHGVTMTFSHNGVEGNAMDNMVMGFAGNDGLTTRFGMVSNVDVLAGSVNFAGLSQQRLSFTAPYWMSGNDQSAVGLQQGFGLADGNLSFTAVSSHDRSGVAAAYSLGLADAYIPTIEIGIVNGKDSLFGTETGGALGFGDKTETRFVGMRGEYTRDALTLFHSAYMGQSDVSARGLISGIDTVVTSSWVVGGKFDHGIQQFGLVVAQPLKVESANTSLSFIDGYQNGAFTTSTVNVDLAPTGRQINTELYFATSSRILDDIKVSLMRMDQPGHNAYAKAEHVATFSLGTRF
jgi:subtilisin family serine protease